LEGAGGWDNKDQYPGSKGETLPDILSKEFEMNVIADIAIIPIGIGISLSKYVAACEQVLSKAGLKPQLHANGTNVEGEWDDVFGAIKQCHEVLHAMGAPRVATNLRIGTRVDKVQTMVDKIASVESKIGKTPLT
jgi:uncharacterized protein (TIGR00106 family)